jgi:iron complex transport system substrate-binding protein
MGRTVEIKAAPVRIVTVSPTATETLYLVGAKAVARDTSSKYPPEAQNIPTVGSAMSPTIEAVAAQSPDLIIAEALTQGRLAKVLEGLNVPVIFVRATSLDDVVKSLAIVGQAVNNGAEAVRAIETIKSRIDAAKASVRRSGRVLILISDADRNVYAAKPESYPGAVAGMINLENLAKGLPDSGPYPGFALFTGEQAVTGKPDVIFTISPAPAPAPRLSDMLGKIPGFADLDAVKAGRVREISPTLFLQAQGPRIAEAAEEMGRLMTEILP